MYETRVTLETDSKAMVTDSAGYHETLFKAHVPICGVVGVRYYTNDRGGVTLETENATIQFSDPPKLTIENYEVPNTRPDVLEPITLLRANKGTVVMYSYGPNRDRSWRLSEVGIPVRQSYTRKKDGYEFIPSCMDGAIFISHTSMRNVTMVTVAETNFVPA